MCRCLPRELVTKFSTTSNQFTPQLVSLLLLAAIPSCFCLCKFVSNNKTTLMHIRASTEDSTARSPRPGSVDDYGNAECSSAGTIMYTSTVARGTKALIHRDLLYCIPYNGSVCLLLKPTAVKYKEQMPPTGQAGYNSWMCAKLTKRPSSKHGGRWSRG